MRRLHKTFKVRYKANKDWDSPIPISPVFLYMHTMGANREERRAGRPRDQVKEGYIPPGSMMPAVKRLNQETGKVEYVASR